MFMVGSFASGLSEGLESGWKLGKDIQDRGYEEDRRAKFRKAEAEKKDTTLPALKGIAAEAPSPTESPPMLTGSTNLTVDGYNPDETYTPAKTTNGRVATGATPALTPPWQSQITRVPDDDKPAAKPAAGFQPEVLSRPPQPAVPAALPMAAPEELAPPVVAQPDATMQLPGRGNYAPVPVGPAVPAPTMPIKDWWNRTFGAPPIGGALIGGGRGRDRPAPSYSPPPVIPSGPPTALGGRGNYDPQAASPGRSASPPSSGWMPVAPAAQRWGVVPSSPPIDPLTGQPYQQAVPY